MKGGLAIIVVILLSSIFLIIMGLVYFLVTLWIITVGADILNMNLDGNFAVLSASLITLGVIVGSSLARKN